METDENNASGDKQSENPTDITGITTAPNNEQTADVVRPEQNMQTNAAAASASAVENDQNPTPIPQIDTSDSKVFISILQNDKNHLEVGLAVIDLNFSSLTLYQFKDNETFDIFIRKLEIIDPGQIIFPENLIPLINPMSAVKKVNSKKYISLKNNLFNRKRGLSSIERYCSFDYRNHTQIISKSLAVSSFAALIKYIETTLPDIHFAPKSIRLNFENNEDMTIIDSSTSKHLELISNSRNLKSENNLFGLLNVTKTKNGNKSLRANILQPPCNIDQIEKRLTMVQELSENLELYANLCYLISNFHLLEEIINFCYQIPKNEFENRGKTDRKIYFILAMRSVLAKVSDLNQVLRSSKAESIKSLFESHFDEEKFRTINDEIDKVMDENITIANNNLIKDKKFFAIKENIDNFFDLTRRAYSEYMQKIRDYNEEIRAETDFTTKLGFNSSRGYFMEISLKGTKGTKGAKGKEKETENSASSIFSTDSTRFLLKLPDEFIKISKSSSSVQFTTVTLMRLNERINHCNEFIYTATDKIVNELINKLRKHFDCFYKMSEFLSNLDMVCSLFNYVLESKSTCSRPKFGSELSLTKAYHPVLLKMKAKGNATSSKNETMLISKDGRIVDNSIKMSRHRPFILITGANMSGKSTFLKEVGNLQVMAQCGSYVSVGEGHFNMKKRIFALNGDYSNNSNSMHQSSFEREMADISYILQNLNVDSLILIDELCRNTNYFEGLALSMSICNYLLETLQTTDKNIDVIFATHYKELAYLECIHPSLKCYHFESKVGRGNKLEHTFQLENGVNELKNYGYPLIELNPLPQSIIKDTKQLIQIFDRDLDDLFVTDKTEKKKILIINFYYDFSEIAKNVSDEPDGNEDLVDKIETLIAKFEKQYLMLDAQS